MAKRAKAWVRNATEVARSQEDSGHSLRELRARVRAQSPRSWKPEPERVRLGLEPRSQVWGSGPRQ